MEKQDTARWTCHYKLSKYHQDIEPYRGSEPAFYEKFQPYEVIEGEGNCLLNAGINEMWDLITGGVSGAGHIFDNAAAQIGVGDDDTAADPAQTDLQAATNKTYKGMESGYPTSSQQKATFKASFGDSEANYAWEEWVVKQATSAICLNRKVESLGTKSSGTWTLEVSITLS
ncbi:MAG TPA: hypothetical protein G4N91_01115 [Dehalococcoidia bacterium]|nr:hypothetical protein [Dehalococcoidia bacterium]